MREIDVIGYACGVGAADDSCKDAAEYLKRAVIEKVLHAKGLKACWTALSESGLPHPETSAEKLNFITEHCHSLADAVKASILNKHFPLVFGGDHSMAIGTWSGLTHALQAEGEIGLLWLDAHMDAHTNMTSETGNIHGMPVAALMGRGHTILAQLKSEKAKVNPKHMVLMGIRSYEQGEHELLTSMGVTIYYMDEIKERGFEVVYDEALKIVTHQTKGFGISFDIDAFDAELVPGTGTKEEYGLRRREVLPIMRGIAHHPMLKAIEIAEYNPHLDENHQTLQLVEQMLEAFFASPSAD